MVERGHRTAEPSLVVFFYTLLQHAVLSFARSINQLSVVPVARTIYYRAELKFDNKQKEDVCRDPQILVGNVNYWHTGYTCT